MAGKQYRTSVAVALSKADELEPKVAAANANKAEAEKAAMAFAECSTKKWVSFCNVQATAIGKPSPEECEKASGLRIDAGLPRARGVVAAAQARRRADFESMPGVNCAPCKCAVGAEVVFGGQ
jgi:hypothetical protein